MKWATETFENLGVNIWSRGNSEHKSPGEWKDQCVLETAGRQWGWSRKGGKKVRRQGCFDRQGLVHLGPWRPSFRHRLGLLLLLWSSARREVWAQKWQKMVPIFKSQLAVVWRRKQECNMKTTQMSAEVQMRNSGLNKRGHGQWLLCGCVMEEVVLTGLAQVLAVERGWMEASRKDSRLATYQDGAQRETCSWRWHCPLAWTPPSVLHLSWC